MKIFNLIALILTFLPNLSRGFVKEYPDGSLFWSAKGTHFLSKGDKIYDSSDPSFWQIKENLEKNLHYPPKENSRVQKCKGGSDFTLLDAEADGKIGFIYNYPDGTMFFKARNNYFISKENKTYHENDLDFEKIYKSLNGGNPYPQLVSEQESLPISQRFSIEKPQETYEKLLSDLDKKFQNKIKKLLKSNLKKARAKKAKNSLPTEEVYKVFNKVLSAKDVTFKNVAKKIKYEVNEAVEARRKLLDK